MITDKILLKLFLELEKDVGKNDKTKLEFEQKAFKYIYLFIIEIKERTELFTELFQTEINGKLTFFKIPQIIRLTNIAIYVF